MPRPVKLKPSPAPQPELQLAAVNGLPGEVLTLAEAAAYLRLPEKELISAVHTQSLPGRLIGGEWRFLKTAIQQWLGTGSPNTETRKAAQLALAGKCKEDPDLEQIVEGAMRARGRSPREDGSHAGLNRE